MRATPRASHRSSRRRGGGDRTTRRPHRMSPRSEPVAPRASRRASVVVVGPSSTLKSILQQHASHDGNDRGALTCNRFSRSNGNAPRLEDVRRHRQRRDSSLDYRRMNPRTHLSSTPPPTPSSPPLSVPSRRPPRDIERVSRAAVRWRAAAGRNARLAALPQHLPSARSTSRARCPMRFIVVLASNHRRHRDERRARPREPSRCCPSLPSPPRPRRPAPSAIPARCSAARYESRVVISRDGVPREISRESAVSAPSPSTSTGGFRCSNLGDITTSPRWTLTTSPSSPASDERAPRTRTPAS